MRIINFSVSSDLDYAKVFSINYFFQLPIKEIKKCRWEFTKKYEA